MINIVRHIYIYIYKTLFTFGLYDQLRLQIKYQGHKKYLLQDMCANAKNTFM